MDNRLNLNECTYRTLEKEILGETRSISVWVI
jgi:hypothetical protein